MITEADEAAASKAEALDNLREQARKRETMGVRAMYERAALNLGATPAECEAAEREGRTHWVYGSGSAGCLYDSGPYVADTLDDAIEGALEPFLGCDPELSEEQEKDARIALREQHTYYLPRGMGADYCEVSRCQCLDPRQHDPEWSP